MIETEYIRLEDRDVVERIRKEAGSTLAANAFSSLYVWRKDMQLSMAENGEAFIVKYGAMDGENWFFPCGSDEGRKQYIDSLMKEGEFHLLYAEEKDCRFLEENYPGRFEFTRAEEDDEYLYDLEQQCELKGRRFSSIRNHVRRGSEEGISFRPLDSTTAEDAVMLNESWLAERKTVMGDDSEGLHDESAADILLKNREALGAEGLVFYKEDKPFGVVAGYPLSDDTFDMAMAKQLENRGGIPAYLKYMFFRHLEGRYDIVNCEEDLGIPGLRAMKEQMRPSGKNILYHVDYRPQRPA